MIRMDYIELHVFITVRSWPGLDRKKMDFDVLRTTTIESVKTRVMEDNTHLGSDDVCLMYGTQKLDETKMLRDYNIVDGDKMEIWRYYHDTSVIDEPSPSSV